MITISRKQRVTHCDYLRQADYLFPVGSRVSSRRSVIAGPTTAVASSESAVIAYLQRRLRMRISPQQRVRGRQKPKSSLKGGRPGKKKSKSRSSSPRSRENASLRFPGSLSRLSVPRPRNQHPLHRYLSRSPKTQVPSQNRWFRPRTMTLACRMSR